MRPIKFRAWDKRLKLMTRPFGIGEGIVFYDGQQTYYNTNHIPMQYTGMKDKNGKEIYEGDIVEYRKDVAIIKYINSAFMLAYINEDKYDFIEVLYKYSPKAYKLKVIGNIYENPELLKGE